MHLGGVVDVVGLGSAVVGDAGGTPSWLQQLKLCGLFVIGKAWKR